LGNRKRRGEVRWQVQLGKSGKRNIGKEGASYRHKAASEKRRHLGGIGAETWNRKGRLGGEGKEYATFYIVELLKTEAGV